MSKSPKSRKPVPSTAADKTAELKVETLDHVRFILKRLPTAIRGRCADDMAVVIHHSGITKSDILAMAAVVTGEEETAGAR